MPEPKEGLLTFRGEGKNIRGDRYFSRVIHFPVNYNACSGALSGVTLGRGYDLGGRSESEVISDLLFCGVPNEQANKIAKGAKLTGCKAGNFVRENQVNIGEITEQQQLRLFEKIFPKYILRAKKD